MNGVLCTPEQASCLIPNLIVELTPPCPLDGAGGLVLCGLGYNGQKVTVRVLDGVLEVEGVPAEEVEAMGDPLVVEFRSFTAVRVMFVIGIVLVILSVLLFRRRYRIATRGSGLRRA